MAIKLVLSSEQISEKVFKAVPRGYDPYEVNKFLDRIMRDYEKIEANQLLTNEELDKLNSKIKSLEKEKADLELQLGRLKTKYAGVKEGDKVTDENLDLIKRIRRLETFLWQNGFNPNNIK